MTVQKPILFGDAADAYAFWKDKEFKKFAVDVVVGQGKKRRVHRTIYVWGRKQDDAAITAKRNDMMPVPRAHYYARLAGPRELGCVPLPKQINSQP